MQMLSWSCSDSELISISANFIRLGWLWSLFYCELSEENVAPKATVKYGLTTRDTQKGGSPLLTPPFDPQKAYLAEAGFSIFALPFSLSFGEKIGLGPTIKRYSALQGPGPVGVAGKCHEPRRASYCCCCQALPKSLSAKKALKTRFI